MSHPEDRRHRFLISVNKGMKRVSTWNFGRSKEEQKKGIENQARRHRDTTKSCGQWCCANRRKWEGLTRQELKFFEKEKLDL